MSEMMSGTPMWPFGPLMMLVFAALIIVPFWFIFTKAGYSQWWGLLMAVPIVNLVMLVFPRVFRLAKAARKGNQARMTEHACLLTVLVAEFHT